MFFTYPDTKMQRGQVTMKLITITDMFFIKLEFSVFDAKVLSNFYDFN